MLHIKNILTIFSFKQFIFIFFSKKIEEQINGLLLQSKKNNYLVVPVITIIIKKGMQNKHHFYGEIIRVS